MYTQHSRYPENPPESNSWRVLVFQRFPFDKLVWGLGPLHYDEKPTFAALKQSLWNTN